MADAAARPARPARLAVQVGVGVRGLAGAARRAARAGSPARGARLPRAQRVLDRRLGALGGRGAVADQVRFDREWAALRSHAEERGVRLIGDVPIYVAPGSADHRAHPELFRDDAVAGTPPDAYTDKGQLWGNPLYDWPALRRRGYRWWTERFRAHVRALRPRADRPLPRLRRLLGGAARRAPRAERALAPRAGARAVRRRRSTRSAALPLIAEDLGVITPAVDAPARRARAPRAWSSCSSASTPATQERAPPGQPRRATASSTRARTTTTPCAAGTTRCPDAVARGGRRRDRRATACASASRSGR